MKRIQDATNDEVFSMLDYLAWKLRCSSFQNDFKNRVKEWYQENTEHDDDYATYSSIILWDTYIKKGMVETYQEFISDEEICKAFVYAVNI